MTVKNVPRTHITKKKVKPSVSHVEQAQLPLKASLTVKPSVNIGYG